LRVTRSSAAVSFAHWVAIRTALREQLVDLPIRDFPARHSPAHNEKPRRLPAGVIQ